MQTPQVFHAQSCNSYIIFRKCIDSISLQSSPVIQTDPRYFSIYATTRKEHFSEHFLLLPLIVLLPTHTVHVINSHDAKCFHPQLGQLMNFSIENLTSVFSMAFEKI